MIRNPLNKSLIGFSYRRSSNIKTYFINIKSHSGTSKMFIREDELGYFSDIIDKASKDLVEKKLLLKKARENREKFKAVTKGELEKDVEEEEGEEEIEGDIVDDLKELEKFKELEERAKLVNDIVDRVDRLDSVKVKEGDDLGDLGFDI